MTLLYPIWLVLLIPLIATLWLWRLPSRLLIGLRILTIALVLLALTDLSLRLPTRAATVVVVVDRSDSMPIDSQQRQKEAIEQLRQSMSDNDVLQIVTFGRGAVVEDAPKNSEFSGFLNQIDGDASNLGDALQQALKMIPKGAPGRIFVLSDGRWTGRDPMVVASQAAAQSIPIDFRPLQRGTANDLAIERLDVPERVNPGESFLVTAWIYSPTARKSRITLRRGDTVLFSEEQQLEAGSNPIRFRDRAGDPGTMAYTLQATSNGDDPVQENNRARTLLGVRGLKPMLHVSQSGKSSLAQLLRNGRINLREKKAEDCTWNLEELSRYSSVILENVPAEKIGHEGMETLSAWVRETGAGLMMTGGRDSYAPGGYYESPLDPILPVSMELRQEHRKLSLAIVVALDRSGSMSAPIGGGSRETKMDLANRGTAEVLKLLSAMDEFGVLAVDSQPHVIAPLASVKDKDDLKNKILGIQSMGGGIYVYEALSEASRMLTTAKSGTRHIILFSDAADSEQPGDYKKLLDACQKAGITVSVIGLGTKADPDAALLEDIAKRGKGRCFFTSKPEELPRLFAQDTFVVARNTFLDEPTSIKSTGGLTTLTGRGFNFTQNIGGYNLTYLRPEATLDVLTLDDYKAPVVANWHAGSGRVLCYTGEADGRHVGRIAQWDKVGEFFTSLARWTNGQDISLPGNMALTQELRNGVNVVKLHLDPERKSDAFDGLPSIKTLRSDSNRAPEKSSIKMRWEDADTLVAEVPLQGREVAMSSIELEAGKPVTLPPVTLPYSPEHQPGSARNGVEALSQLSRGTGGKERAELTQIWKDIPKQPRLISLAPWLLIAALVVLLMEVFERRTGMLTQFQSLVWAKTVEKRATWSWLARRRAQKRLEGQPEKLETSEKETSKSEPTVEPVPVAEEGGVMGALRQARRRTRDKYRLKGDDKK